MSEWLHLGPNVAQNAVAGAVGGIVVILYQLYKLLPDIQSVDSPGLAPPHIPPRRTNKRRIALVCLKAVISVLLAAFASGVLVRPQEIVGAIITGMTWQNVFKNLIENRQ
jgi:hypothetical protein